MLGSLTEVLIGDFLVAGCRLLYSLGLGQPFSGREKSMRSEPDRRDFVRLGAAAGAALALSGAPIPAHGQLSGTQEDRLSFFDVVKSRRSVRKFKDTPVPEEHLMAILDAARLAPTSGNQQPWKFLVLRERSRIDDLKEACIEASLAARQARQGTVSDEDSGRIRQYFTDYLSAPVYVVILTDNESTYPTYNHWDGPLAAGYLMLAARALGYGTVHATDSIPDAITKEVLGIPDRYTRVCITPIGVPEAWPDSPPKRELEEFIVSESF
jgi:nitroreductase